MSRFLSWFIIPFTFVLDRVLKIWVLHSLEEGESIPVWARVFHLTRVDNTGAAFGLWRNAPLFLTVVTAVSVLAIFVHLFGAIRSHRRLSRSFSGWALVVGGALGNLYDRIHFGYVIDFIDLRVWPVFNVADSAICLGVFWIFLSLFRKHAPDTV